MYSICSIEKLTEVEEENNQDVFTFERETAEMDGVSEEMSSIVIKRRYGMIWNFFFRGPGTLIHEKKLEVEYLVF